MKPIIKVENLSKLYRLGQVGTGTLSHDLNRWWAKVRGIEDPFSKVGHINDRTQKAEEGEYIWALKDVTFEIKQGNVLGIIGGNGAGKSTLLKLISRITAPTTGRIRYRGKVASLLEVGTGMHPELSGKENVYLNGSILGMTKAEISKKLDAIMDFAGCLKYVDTPIKRYSTGMMVRLGFAVAAFLEQDILIVDEVLAVGDAEFQKKAIGKMEDVSKGEGRTILFVSHNMAAVENLCNRAMLLENGRNKATGTPNEVISLYLERKKKDVGLNNLFHLVNRTGSGKVKFGKIEIEGPHKNRKIVKSGDCIKVKLFFESKIDRKIRIDFTIVIKGRFGNSITSCSSKFFNKEFFFTNEGLVICHIKDLNLLPGIYYISLWCGYGAETYDLIEESHILDIDPGDVFGSGITLDGRKYGHFLIDQKWDLQNG